MSPTLFLIIGNSASGKDSVIKYAMIKNNSITKAKRYITREQSNTEDFVSIKKEEFNPNEYLLYWNSYEKYYGVKKEDIILPLENNKHVFVNISRQVINQAKKLWNNVKIIEFKVPIELTKKRLIQRNRESNEEITKRLNRAKQEFDINSDIIIDSSNPNVSIAGEKLLNFIETIDL